MLIMVDLVKKYVSIHKLYLCTLQYVLIKISNNQCIDVTCSGRTSISSFKIVSNLMLLIQLFKSFIISRRFGRSDYQGFGAYLY